MRTLARRPQDGFTITEVVMASLICFIAVLATAALIDMSSRSNASIRQHDGATNLARELVEGARTVPYERVSTTSLVSELQDMPGLSDSPGGGYTIRRDNVNYSVGIDVCVMDDPKDGGGPRSAGVTFCSGSAAAGTADRNPEDYKRVTVKTTWTRNSRTREVSQTGIINNPGSASGPAVRTITPQLASGAPWTVTDPGTTSVGVTLTTSSRPTTINWLLDGTVRSPAPTAVGASGLNWTFTWNIGTVATGTLDGSYIVSAEAFDQYGVSGPGRQETIVLNRRVPFAPIQVTGGRTVFGTVEIEWTANSERDIVGYQVVRVDDGAVICAMTTQKLATECTDTSPPAAPSPVSYVVYAYDKAPGTGAARQGDASAPLLVTSLNTPPNPPTGVTAVVNADGSATVTWSRPSPADPDAGDSVDYYRVYRDGIALENRVARWFDSAATVSWTDTDRTAVDTHEYWVTSVDRNYTESSFEKATP